MVRIVYARQVNGRLRQIKPVRRPTQLSKHSSPGCRCRGNRPACPALRRGQLSMRFV